MNLILSADKDQSKHIYVSEIAKFTYLQRVAVLRLIADFPRPPNIFSSFAFMNQNACLLLESKFLPCFYTHCAQHANRFLFAFHHYGEVLVGSISAFVSYGVQTKCGTKRLVENVNNLNPTCVGDYNVNLKKNVLPSKLSNQVPVGNLDKIVIFI